MAVMTINRNINLGGVAHAENRTVAVGRVSSFEEAVPLAKTGTLTVRTDANTGSLTMSTGHGITTGARLAIFWLDATTGLQKCQRRVTAGTVSGNVVPIDLGTGDDLPLAASTVQVAITQEVDLTITAADVIGFVFHTQKVGLVEICRADGTEIAARVLLADNSVWEWDSDLGEATPLSNTIGKIYVSHKGTTGAGSSTTYLMKGAFAGS